MQITLPPAGKLPAIKAALTLLPEKHRHLPPELAEFEKLLDTLRDLPEPLTDTEIARSLADAEPNELPALLDTLATEKARGEALRAANGNGLRTLLERRRSSAVLAALPDVLERLAPVFTQATDTLAKAGAELPEGAAALDPQAVLDSNAGSAYHQARQALDTIQRIGAVVPVHLRQDGTTRSGSQCVAVVDVPVCGPYITDGLTTGYLNNPDELELLKAVGRLVDDYNTDPRLALLEVVRGRYTGCSLSLAATVDEAQQRIERISTASKVKREDALSEHQRRSLDRRQWRTVR
ncbi:hypothetical protein ACFS2C_11830 [Prauserella oleivorans]|uniref:Uncharacterized protein n=1 Tax=Prauserella oleivorans TaxID=1478153 RepID=A0ABW5WCL4_9PSEU